MMVRVEVPELVVAALAGRTKQENRVMTSRNKAMIFFAILIYLQIINDGCIVLT